VAFEAAGARLVPVPVDGDGLDVSTGMRLAPDARLAYVTPSHQFPLGVVMSASRRLQLLRWARANGAWIFEDDYDSEFRYAGRPLPCLQGLEAERSDGSPPRVLYVGTFSKTLVSGLRLGYMVVPDALIEPFRAARSTVDRHTPTIYQQVLADFIGEGHYFRHIRHVRSLCAERQAALVEAAATRLDGLLHLRADPAGLHLVGRLAPGIDDVVAQRAAMARGVRSWALSKFYLGDPPPEGALVLGYGGFGVEEIGTGVGVLAEVLGGMSGNR
jgi:GntR family transcriptional regulator / MocR family aminotransferase